MFILVSIKVQHIAKYIKNQENNFKFWTQDTLCMLKYLNARKKKKKRSFLYVCH
jgi:hypothetical protein